MTRRGRDKARRWRRTQRNRFDPEDAPTRERIRPTGRDFGTRHLGGWERKSLSETLNPLERFLNKQVGRPWDKVYSEISKNLDPSNAVKQHVRDHLGDFVELYPTFDEEGRVCSNYRWDPEPLKVGKLYVCPNTGILRRVRKGKPKRRDYWHPRTHKCLDGRLAVRGTDGIWYWVELARIPAGLPGSTLFLRYGEKNPVPKAVRENLHDVIWGSLRGYYGGQLGYGIPSFFYGLPGRYATARFPLSKKDLRTQRLVNREQ